MYIYFIIATISLTNCIPNKVTLQIYPVNK